MIAFLRGEILSQDAEGIVLDVRGVGYELHCSQSTLDELAGQSGAVEIFVYTHLRAEALQLYGFAQMNEKQLFLSLTRVNGIGPKMAIRILSGAKTGEIVGMIEEGDAKSLASLPKVGKKTAEQIVLTLKGKLVLNCGEVGVRSNSSVRQEILSALVNLGYRSHDVEKAVAQLDTKTDVQNGIREGLRILSANF